MIMFIDNDVFWDDVYDHVSLQAIAVKSDSCAMLCLPVIRNKAIIEQYCCHLIQLLQGFCTYYQWQGSGARVNTGAYTPWMDE